MIKKAGVMVILLIFISIIANFASAEGEKLEISTMGKDIFLPGEIIPLKVSLFDSGNNLMEGKIKLIIEDAEGRFSLEKETMSNKVIDINLGSDAPGGYWKITASYNEAVSTALFMVETSELVKFELAENTLIVTNIGNTRYTKAIQIVIGETIGSKQIDLNVGESMSFRLIAPDGTYNVKVTDGKTTITQGGVSLTGNVIGILDNTNLSRSPFTLNVGGESPYSENNTSRNNLIVYVFLLIIFVAAILLTIERRYKRTALEHPLKDI